MLNAIHESKDTKIKLLSNNTTVDADLITLVDSGLIENDVLSFSEDSFAFETGNILLPCFIDKNFASFRTLIGLPIPTASFTPGVRKLIHSRFVSRISSADKLKDIRGILRIDQITKKLIQTGKDHIGDLLGAFFNKKIIDSYKINVSAYSSDAANEFFFILDLQPELSTEEILGDYLDAVKHQNKIYRSLVGGDKLAFCPTESPLGTQILWLTQRLNNTIANLNNIIVNEYIEVVAEVLEVEINDYLVETVKRSGIEQELSSIYYYKNIVMPLGTAAICSDSKSDKKICLAYLKPDVFVKFLPYTIDMEEYTKYFESVSWLEKLYTII